MNYKKTSEKSSLKFKLNKTAASDDIQIQMFIESFHLISFYFMFKGEEEEENNEIVDQSIDANINEIYSIFESNVPDTINFIIQNGDFIAEELCGFFKMSESIDQSFLFLRCIHSFSKMTSQAIVFETVTDLFNHIQ